MTLLKTAEADRFLRSPEGKSTLILLFGPDPGGVSERAATLAKRLVGDDAYAVVRIESDELGADPGRLADEVFAPSLFAGRRVVRFRVTGSRNVVPAIQPVLERPPADTWLVVEAGDLRKTSPLRKLFESARAAIAIGCYTDNDAAIGRTIDEELGAADVRIAADARAALIALLGTDRTATRSEIRKLALYAGAGGSISAQDVAALIGDGADIGVDDIVEAAAGGDMGGVDRGARRLLAEGTGAGTIGLAAERHFLQLHLLAAVVERGGTIGSVLEGFRPPLIPSRRAALERQLRLWSRPDLDSALMRISQAIFESRQWPALATGIVLTELVTIARRAERAGRPRG